jgi:hypothetical protein
MMRYQVTTRLSPNEALEQALHYFGPPGVGLMLTSQTPYGAVLQGGGGHVSIILQAAAATIIELETREWDYPVQQFMAGINRSKPWWRQFWGGTKHVASQPAYFNILNDWMVLGKS